MDTGGVWPRKKACFLLTDYQRLEVTVGWQASDSEACAPKDKTMMVAPIKFNTTPSLAISAVVTRPDP